MLYCLTNVGNETNLNGKKETASDTPAYQIITRKHQY